MNKLLAVCLMFGVLIALPLIATAAPSGAIFTTVADGSEVNVNQYPAKEDVYLDGGPGIGAPATAAGLDDGVYVFMVTDPSGKTLLSSDIAACRMFQVTGGIITAVVGACAHNTGFDVDHGAVTVQLFPYDDTPNPGGVYKAWATPAENFPVACLNTVDCTKRGTKHGFDPAFSKTDNFKVKEVPVREIDGYFLEAGTKKVLTGMLMTWIDPLGASNRKWSYYNTFWSAVEAHVEGIEDGDHSIVIENQPGCTVGDIYLGNWENWKAGETYVGTGPQIVKITVRGYQKATSPYLKIHCR